MFQLLGLADRAPAAPPHEPGAVAARGCAVEEDAHCEHQPRGEEEGDPVPNGPGGGRDGATNQSDYQGGPASGADQRWDRQREGAERHDERALVLARRCGGGRIMGWLRRKKRGTALRKWWLCRRPRRRSARARLSDAVTAIVVGHACLQRTVDFDTTREMRMCPVSPEPGQHENLDGLFMAAVCVLQPSGWRMWLHCRSSHDHRRADCELSPWHRGVFSRGR